jgi:hypothetical protein
VKLVVSSPRARACDLLLEDQEATRIVSASYADSGPCAATGVLRRRADRVAVALSCTADAAMNGHAVVLELSTPTRSLHEIEVLSTACYDGLGAPIPTTLLAWE